MISLTLQFAKVMVFFFISILTIFNMSVCMMGEFEDDCWVEFCVCCWVEGSGVSVKWVSCVWGFLMHVYISYIYIVRRHITNATTIFRCAMYVVTSTTKKKTLQ